MTQVPNYPFQKYSTVLESGQQYGHWEFYYRSDYSCQDNFNAFLQNTPTVLHLTAIL